MKRFMALLIVIAVVVLVTGCKKAKENTASEALAPVWETTNTIETEAKVIPEEKMDQEYDSDEDSQNEEKSSVTGIVTPTETTPPATETTKPTETTPPATEATKPTETTPPATEATKPTETTPPATETNPSGEEAERENESEIG